MFPSDPRQSGPGELGALFMRFPQRIVEKSKEALLKPMVLRWVTDDRVMKATEGFLDARSRFKAAWQILKRGHELPPVDPALDESIGETAPEVKKPQTNGNGAAHATNGHNGHGIAISARPSLSSGSAEMEESMKERTSLANIGGKDVLEKCQKFMAADNARKMG